MFCETFGCIYYNIAIIIIMTALLLLFMLIFYVKTAYNVYKTQSGELINEENEKKSAVESKYLAIIDHINSLPL